eukprot:GHVN01067561.1.p1 GENE.GHVN01067561.1~~GHVN01067561.1.p1  ORF type:complete len:941 (-),score=156.69 GHVN01067561.1:1305-4127(-)
MPRYYRNWRHPPEPFYHYSERYDTCCDDWDCSSDEEYDMAPRRRMGLRRQRWAPPRSRRPIRPRKVEVLSESDESSDEGSTYVMEGGQVKKIKKIRVNARNQQEAVQIAQHISQQNMAQQARQQRLALPQYPQNQAMQQPKQHQNQQPQQPPQSTVMSLTEKGIRMGLDEARPPQRLSSFSTIAINSKIPPPFPNPPVSPLSGGFGGAYMGLGGMWDPGPCSQQLMGTSMDQNEMNIHPIYSVNGLHQPSYDQSLPVAPSTLYQAQEALATSSSHRSHQMSELLERLSAKQDPNHSLRQILATIQGTPSTSAANEPSSIPWIQPIQQPAMSAGFNTVLPSARSSTMQVAEPTSVAAQIQKIMTLNAANMALASANKSPRPMMSATPSSVRPVPFSAHMRHPFPPPSTLASPTSSHTRFPPFYTSPILTNRGPTTPNLITPISPQSQSVAVEDLITQAMIQQQKELLQREREIEAELVAVMQAEAVKLERGLAPVGHGATDIPPGEQRPSHFPLLHQTAQKLSTAPSSRGPITHRSAVHSSSAVSASARSISASNSESSEPVSSARSKPITIVSSSDPCTPQRKSANRGTVTSPLSVRSTTRTPRVSNLGKPLSLTSRNLSQSQFNTMSTRPTAPTADNLTTTSFHQQLRSPGIPPSLAPPALSSSLESDCSTPCQANGSQPLQSITPVRPTRLKLDNGSTPSTPRGLNPNTYGLFARQQQLLHGEEFKKQYADQSSTPRAPQIAPRGPQQFSPSQNNVTCTDARPPVKMNISYTHQPGVLISPRVPSLPHTPLSQLNRSSAFQDPFGSEVQRAATSTRQVYKPVVHTNNSNPLSHSLPTAVFGTVSSTTSPGPCYRQRRASHAGPHRLTSSTRETNPMPPPPHPSPLPFNPTSLAFPPSSASPGSAFKNKFADQRRPKQQWGPKLTSEVLAGLDKQQQPR